MVRKALASLAALVVLLGTAAAVSAHAELETANPAPGATVAQAPLTLDLTFSEEVASDGLAVTVVGPAGDEVQAGSAELDLNDLERRHVTLSLQANLPPGRYAVSWRTTSGLDGDAEEGGFVFSVGTTPATPGASPSAGGTPAAVASSVQSTAVAELTVDDGSNGNPLAAEDGNFDGRAFALSVGFGLLAAVAIAVLWRAVRPKNPVFGGRARR